MAKACAILGCDQQGRRVFQADSLARELRSLVMAACALPPSPVRGTPSTPMSIGGAIRVRATRRALDERVQMSRMNLPIWPVTLHEVLKATRRLQLSTAAWENGMGS